MRVNRSNFRVRETRLTRTRYVLLAGALLIVGLAIPRIAAAQSATPVADQYAGEPSTAILVTSTNEPRVILGSDGMRHLEYDLLVTNTYLAPVTLTSVEVLAPDGATLQRLEGDALHVATQPILGGAPQADIPVNGTVAVVMDVVTAPDSRVDAITNRVAYEVPADAPDQALIATRETLGPELAVAPIAPVVIAPPLAGDGWFAVNGCCAAPSIHRYVRVAAGGTSIAKAEMFAIDWVQLRDGMMNSGDGSRVEDYFAYGAEVQAVADGVVVYTHDGMSEQIPGEAPTGIETTEEFAGNQVIVEIEPGVYALYGHLKTGSVAVAVGDQVTTGQVVGLLGNSGQSTAPHLHFGLLSEPNAATGESMPVALDQYELAGTVDPAILSAPEPPPDGKLPVDTTTAGPQSETWPLYLTVVDFP